VCNSQAPVPFAGKPGEITIISPKGRRVSPGAPLLRDGLGDGSGGGPDGELLAAADFGLAAQ